MTDSINVAIIGASGYTGAELIRLLLNHPHATITVLTGDASAGKVMADVYPHLRYKGLPALVALDKVDFSTIDVVFCCLPHGTTQTVIKNLPAHLKIIDLSADFRLSASESYASWYGHPHQAVELQKEAVYGLTEIARDAIRKARLVANPGCYPTSATLPLVPLLAAGAIQAEGIIIDAKSGVTGAGRSAKQANLFTEINDGMQAYGIASHRHTPEIEQSLWQAAGVDVKVTFTPHLIPMNRGILSTIYVTLAKGKTVGDLHALLSARYANEPFVHVLPTDAFPSTHMVRGTNDCMMGVYGSRIAGQAILVSVIDNLVKGASGQAVQNLNVMCGFAETTGLQLSAIFP